MDILVADDDCSGRFLLNSALRELGHSVTETTNGCEAWEAWKRHRHQMIISDMDAAMYGRIGTLSQNSR